MGRQVRELHILHAAAFWPRCQTAAGSAFEEWHGGLQCDTEKSWNHLLGQSLLQMIPNTRCERSCHAHHRKCGPWPQARTAVKMFQKELLSRGLERSKASRPVHEFFWAHLCVLSILASIQHALYVSRAAVAVAACHTCRIIP